MLLSACDPPIAAATLDLETRYGTLCFSSLDEGLLVLGDKSIRSLTVLLQFAMDRQCQASARLGPSDVLREVYPSFYDDVRQAEFELLGLN